MKCNKKIELLNKIKTENKNFELKMDKLYRKKTGSYYTSFDLTDKMVKELISNLIKNNKDLSKLRFLEPCVGTGNFVISYLKEISKLNLNKNDIINIINNIYVADINHNALNQYKKNLYDFVKLYFNINLNENYFDEHIVYGLLIDITNQNPSYIKITDIFPEKVVKKGFDIIITNPPYKNLKAEKTHYLNNNDYELDKIKYKSISKIIHDNFKYCNEGILNLYKVFVEEIIETYSNKNTIINILIPSSILCDKTCSKLRTRLLLNTNIISINLINEKNKYIDAQQGLCSILIEKGNSTKEICIKKDFSKDIPFCNIKIEDIINENTKNSIFFITQEENHILKTLKKFPTVKDLPFIINLRGELDLTLNKKYITNKNTEYPLIRGRNIKYYRLDNLNNIEFISKEFINNSKKNKYILKERIICQQVVNVNKERRLIFSYIGSNYVLGNSCNFIYVENNNYNVDIFAILGIFNTSLMNWFFKLISSNNHINNYEINCFPIPINSPFLSDISETVKEYIKTKNDLLLNKIEDYTYKAFNITQNYKFFENKVLEKYFNDISNIIPNIKLDTLKSILNKQITINSIISKNEFNLNKIGQKVVEGLTNKYLKISQNIILNHTTFKLSNLDIEMIKNIPQGGNWKNIPLETIEKSKRLKKIKETGGRTTLYGRIDYNKPCYTITTYFNRPGNGTYVHPIHNRVISIREAARFQSFKDDYYFFGSKTQLLKQIGNAVPPLLSYQIGKNIIEKTGYNKSIDLFCGAGGITVGFKDAGINSILCNDIEENACITLKINNPEIEVYCADITLFETKNYIIEKGIKEKVDIICGGPPCQGFSMAGNRLNDDPRNQLFKDFIYIVKNIKPKIVVFENVEGLLSFKNGTIYQKIIKLFDQIGYEVEGQTLLATDYAIPQKRKRVIIICTRKDLTIKPKELFPVSITISPESQINAKDTIYDLETIPCEDDAKYIASNESKFVQFLKNKIDFISLIS